MSDEPAVQDVTAQAHELGADILAKLDELTQQPRREAVTLEQRKMFAQQAIDKINSIVAAAHETKTVSAQEEIDRIKASIGA